MKTNRVFKIALLFTISIFFSSCFKIEPVNIGQVEKVKIREISSEKVRLQLKLPISNPNSFRITIEEIHIDLKVNGKDLGLIKNTEELVIEAGHKDYYDFEVEAGLGSSFGGLLSLVPSLFKNEIRLDYKGFIQVKALLIRKQLDINENIKVKVFKE